MANIRTRNQLDIFNSLDERFNEMGLTYDGYDSFRNILSDIISSELFSLNSEFYNKFQDLQLSNATEDALDELAKDLFNLNRLPPAKASSSIPDQNVVFYLESNKTLNITIPKGTKLSSLNSFEEEDLFYITTEDATLNAGEKEIYVNVLAKDAGSSFNIGANRLVHWSSDVLEDQDLQCKNSFAIINGADLESDRNFRIRCSNYIESSIAKNSDFISKTLYEVPGVLEATQHQGYFGLGSTAYSVRGAGRLSNPSFRRTAENRMRRLLRTGEDIKIIDNVTVLFSLEMEIISRVAVSDEEKELLKADIKDSIEEIFVSSSKILNFSSISNLVSRRITNFSFVTDSGSIFKVIKISKSAERYLGQGADNSFKDTLIGNTYTLKSYETAEISISKIDVSQVV